MDNKYKLTDNTKECFGHTLHQIKALKSFLDVKKGDLGGWIESYHNLSQSDYAWVYDNAMVYDWAKICGSAKVWGHAKVYNQAQVGGSAVVGNNTIICGDNVID